MSSQVYRQYSQSELDKAYDQREWAANMQQILQSWRDALAHRAADWQEIAYGPGPRHRVDLYPLPANGATDDALVHFHVHGGAWCRQSKEDAAFIAPVLQASRLVTAIPDFDLLPAVNMPEMLAQLRQSFIETMHHLSGSGVNTDHVIVSGHSSGAHLAALLGATDWTSHGMPGTVIGSLLLISGPYDLEPVLLSARRSYIELDTAGAFEMNAYQQADRIRCPAHLLYGENESPEFIRQSLAMARRLEAHNPSVELTMVPGANHFEMMDMLGRDGSPVHHALVHAAARLRARM